MGVMPLILAMIQVDYETPILFGGSVEIASRMDWIGRTSLTMAHQLTDAGTGRRSRVHAPCWWRMTTGPSSQCRSPRIGG